MIVTVLTDILCAINLPPITASPVHKACPNVPPIVTPTTFCRKKKHKNFNKTFEMSVWKYLFSVTTKYTDVDQKKQSVHSETPVTCNLP